MINFLSPPLLLSSLWLVLAFPTGVADAWSFDNEEPALLRKSTPEIEVVTAPAEVTVLTAVRPDGSFSTFEITSLDRDDREQFFSELTVSGEFNLYTCCAKDGDGMVHCCRDGNTPEEACGAADCCREGNSPSDCADS